MNAFKRYCKGRGWAAEEDFPYMPYQEPGSSQVLDAIEFNAEKATIAYHANIGTTTTRFDRSGDVDADFE